jgi:ABC-type dipeptide/oligopeptide/nickel transport system ATPase component
MEVRNLVTRFYTQEGTVYAVNDVSYTLNEGETLGIVGESGSGKSVHALSIMRLIPRTRRAKLKAERSFSRGAICSSSRMRRCGACAGRRSP